MATTPILQAAQIERKLQRIARQIVEAHLDAPGLHLISIAGNGEHVGNRLERILKNICDIPLSPATITLNKTNPLSEPIQCNRALSDFKEAHVVLVDDVLNSGKTLIYAVNYILGAGPTRISTAVLVDRIHRDFPVRADFCGLSLSTNLKERIDVEIHSEPNEADTANLMD